MYLTQERGGEPRVSDRPSENHVNEMILRLLDLVVGVIAIIVFAPLLIGLAIAIYASDPGPLIFAQPRIGRNGREFRCLKFRTMVVDATRRACGAQATEISVINMSRVQAGRWAPSSQ